MYLLLTPPINPLKGMDCSGLVNYSIGRDKNEGASTLFIEHAVVCGYIGKIGWDSLEEGMIIGKLVYSADDHEYTEAFDQKRISRDGKYKIPHVGIFGGFEEINGEIRVIVYQSTKSKGGGIKTSFTFEKMEDLGWNVWMWPKEVLPEGYDVRDIK